MTTQTDPQSAPLTVKVANAVHDGKGGFLQVGWKFEPVDAAAARSLTAKRFAA